MASFVPPPPFISKTPQQVHDVFLSFRGEDTRYTFTSHLYAALSRLQVKTYIDNELERGDEISPSLLKAIDDAKASIIVFSDNYASSRWCLDELVKILECKRKNGQIIVPIFYHINPTQVRHQTGSYAHAFEMHEKRFVDNMNKVQTWRLALAEVANISGWDCLTTRVESELVEKIAMDILQKLDSITSGGLERRITTYRQMAQQKLEKSLRTGNMSDMEDLITTLHQLAELKLERAMRTDDSSVWEDLMATYKRILQLKQDRWMRTFNAKDMEDLEFTRQHVMQIQREQANREQGFRGI
ncbi:TMV resistance protein N [Spatholobus suberectus]|nr:TMV resistance protein N [Spatholobus suberectus]